MAELSGECAEASHSFFLGSAVVSALERLHAEAFGVSVRNCSPLLLGGARPRIKIHLGYKIRVVSIGTVGGPE